jgi:pimeloyl-ACP methyl ester carboxylesterase
MKTLLGWWLSLLGIALASTGVCASGTAPGTLVDVQPIKDIDPVIRDLGAEALRIHYRSTSDVDGSSTVVGGALFIPKGKPPNGGWIVLAHAHGTTGIINGCGPSLSPNLFGAAPLIAQYLNAGYAVAATDYQGLSGPGIHVYLDSKAEGYNVIDSVRALRNARPGLISDRWVTVGGSQGGGASWAAAEQASVYAQELHLVAAVNLVPAADISGYPQMAENESMTPVQAAAYTAMLITQSRAHPELDMDQYRRGSVASNWDALAQCFGPRMEERNAAVGKIEPAELKPATHAATVKLTGLLEAMAVPQRKADAPMLVIYTGKDEYINPAWTKAAVEKACHLGSRIEVEFQADKGHGTFDWAHVFPWLADRVQGKLLGKTCVTGAAAAVAAEEEKPPTGYSDTPYLPGSRWRVHDGSRPHPQVVTPAAAASQPVGAPSDATILFDGKSLDAWQSEKGGPAGWKVQDGYMEVVAGSGNLVTKQKFRDYQLHVEFREPAPPTGESQERGNSGVFLAGLYEVQVLDSFNNLTYADGQASAIYGQAPPLVNAARSPGEWQTYDIIFTTPRFTNGKISQPGYVTVFFNGVLTQDHTRLLGPSVHHALPHWVAHDPDRPLSLQDHSMPVRFRNIWIRPVARGLTE